MSTLESRPTKAPKPLNSTTVTIAAILLIVLALLFLASPLLGLNRVAGRGNFNRTFNGQNLPSGVLPNNGTGNGQGFQGGTGNGFGQGGTGGNGFGFQGGTGNGFNGGTGRTFNRNGLLGLGILRGTTSIVIYGIALLLSLVAVIGMFLLKNWGRILGIFMAVVYILLTLLSFLPRLLFARFGAAFSNPITLVLNVLHLVLALGVIVFALIPAKKMSTPAMVATPPAAA